jgi:hypothetical protein
MEWKNLYREIKRVFPEEKYEPRELRWTIRFFTVCLT